MAGHRTSSTANLQQGRTLAANLGNTSKDKLDGGRANRPRPAVPILPEGCASVCSSVWAFYLHPPIQQKPRVCE